MATIAVKNFQGKSIEQLELNPNVFSIKSNDTLITQVYVALHAGKRSAIAHTKTRGERAGSNIKPWKQKGTGRARTGSVRNPIWRKGGVTFGPSNERNFKKKVNKKENNLAIRMVLSGKVDSNELVVVEGFKLESIKTKEMAQGLKNLKINKKALLVFSSKERDTMRASKNIGHVLNTTTSSVNVFDMLNNKFLVVSKEGVKELEKLLDKKAPTEKKDNKSL